MAAVRARSAARNAGWRRHQRLQRRGRVAEFRGVAAHAAARPPRRAARSARGTRAAGRGARAAPERSRGGRSPGRPLTGRPPAAAAAAALSQAPADGVRPMSRRTRSLSNQAPGSRTSARDGGNTTSGGGSTTGTTAGVRESARRGLQVRERRLLEEDQQLPRLEHPARTTRPAARARTASSPAGGRSRSGGSASGIAAASTRSRRASSSRKRSGGIGMSRGSGTTGQACPAPVARDGRVPVDPEHGAVQAVVQVVVAALAVRLEAGDVVRERRPVGAAVARQQFVRDVVVQRLLAAVALPELLAPDRVGEDLAGEVVALGDVAAQVGEVQLGRDQLASASPGTRRSARADRRRPGAARSPRWPRRRRRRA